MTADPPLTAFDDRRAANRLLEALQRGRDGAAGRSSLGEGDAHADAALIERAKGALMLHFGVDSFQALSVLVGWSRSSRTPVRTVAHTLLHGICEGDPETEVRQRPLMRWLETQLRDGDPDLPQSPSRPVRSPGVHEVPRSS